LPQKKGKRKKILLELIALPYPIIFYESPRRLKGTMETIYEVFGNRQAVVVKEMTKIYEKVYRGRINELIETFPEDEVKGEFVIIVDGKGKNAL